MVLILGALHLTSSREAAPRFSPTLALVVAAATGGVLIYGTWGLPGFGLSDTPVNTHVGAAYIERSYEDTNIPNVVTAVLGSYRGFDTLGEVTVVFTAGIGVLMLLKHHRRRS
jgi:multicomponent Na+:H+ antiporter subunit B